MDLEQLWHIRSFLPLEAISLTLGIAWAILVMHEKHFIHRDIKLANILP
jgi:serine/threonine protein kinase